CRPRRRRPARGLAVRPAPAPARRPSASRRRRSYGAAASASRRAPPSPLPARARRPPRCPPAPPPPRSHRNVSNRYSTSSGTGVIIRPFATPVVDRLFVTLGLKIVQTARRDILPDGRLRRSQRPPFGIAPEPRIRENLQRIPHQRALLGLHEAFRVRAAA